MTTKQEILDYLDNVLHPIVSPDNWNVYSELHDMIEELPSAEPVKHGKWIDDGQYDNFFPHHEWRCSECGEHVLEIGTPWFKYCPNCGARMDEE